MRELSSQEFKDFGLSDAHLVAVAWEQGGRDMSVALELADHRRVRFFFTWVDKVRVDLQTKEGGPAQPFSWEVSLEEISDTCRRVLFDFAGQGLISLEFSKVAVEEP